MGRRRAGRRFWILSAAALIAVGALLSGVALAETTPRDPGGGGRVIEPPGDTIPGEHLPPGDGNPTGPPVVTSPPPTLPPPTTSGGGFGGGGTGAAPPSDLSVTKTAPDSVIPGGQLSYGISVTKLPGDNAENVVLTDVLPGNTTFQAIASPPGWSCTTPAVGFGGTVICTIASLAPTPSAGFGVQVFVANNTPDGSVITNTANVSSTPPDSNLANNSSSASTTVANPPPPSADLSVTKTGSPDAVTAGNNLNYTIGVTNSGPNPAQSATLSDALPAGTTFVSLTSPAGWSCTTPAVGASGTVSCSNSSFALATAAFTLAVNVNAAAPGGSTISNTASASSSTADPDPANNTATTTSTVATSADLGVTKTAPASAIDGTNITYAIPVTNSGPSDAPSVTVTDVLPAHTTYVSVTPTGGSCAGTSTVTCNVGPIASGATVNIALVVKLDLTTPGGTVIANTASVTSPTTDPNGTNNSATANTTAVAALQSIAVSPANKTLAPGMTQQYTATGTYSDSSTQDLTASSAWTSSSAGVASVSPSGLGTAIAPGVTNVSASVGGKTGAAALHVSPLRLITVRPLLSIMRTGGTRALTATGRFANGVTATINDQVTWSSTNPGVAGVSAQGVVTSASPGVTILVARFGNTFSIPALVLVL